MADLARIAPTHRQAAGCHEKYMSSWGIGWTVPGHRYVGALICEAAARRLYEDPPGEAWNG